jgi:flagellar L-ring protein precursor FlgH
MIGPIARTVIAASLPALAGCGVFDRLSEVGHPPALSPITDPTAGPAYHPISMPMPPPPPPPLPGAGLWRPGARAFFKDQRAARVGDLITVLVNVTDAADVENASSAIRNDSTKMGVPDFFGLQNELPRILPNPIDPAQLVSVTGNANAGGTGKIKRNETITLRIAGEITQLLPNGNMVVAARQEIRVNSELRELLVSGIIRPQDISSENTVQHDRMAEARIAYGGRGQLTNVQTPRYGQQALDILLPF